MLHISVPLWDLSSGNITIAISLVGKVGYVTPPHLFLPLTVEPGKPRLCHDARFLNIWMEDKPFTLDRLGDLPRYVSQDSYQTVLDVRRFPMERLVFYS